jgi:ferredoxin
MKKFLHPSEIRLFTAERDNGVFRILNSDEPVPRRAYLGVRPCDLAAVAIQDRVLLGDRYLDAIYQERRKDIVFIAVNCVEPAGACFCASMGTGPKATGGYDIMLTEVVQPFQHVFVAEAGSEVGRELLEELEAEPAPAEVHKQAEATLKQAAAAMKRKVKTQGIKEMLYDNFENPRWEQVSGRCLTCGNCTLACPTCFCITVEDWSDVRQQKAARWRKWDSCFSQSFSYIHGGSVRQSPKSRYRQWLSHKFGAWIDQFGTSGCVGCGRCITWCPVGIDVTEELAALRGETAEAKA